MRWGYLQSFLPQEIFTIKGYYQLILSLVEWGRGQDRPVLVISPSQNLLHQLATYRYQLIPFGYSMNISDTPSLPPSDFEYSLSTKLATSTNSDQDLWLQGEKGSLSNLHANLAYAYYRLGDIIQTKEHIMYAKNLLHRASLDNELVTKVEAQLQESDP
jgi:hypothetical protein